MRVADFLEWQDSGYNMGPSEPTENLASYYGITSVAYYEQNVSLVPDGIFDLLCKELLDRPDTPSWVDKESLNAGTGYVTTHFPHAVHSVATDLADSATYYQPPKLDDLFDEYAD